MALCQLLSVRACTQVKLLQTTFMVPDGLADNSPALGTLVEPLPKQFSNIYRGIAICIDAKSTFAFEYATSPYASTTTTRANLRSVSCSNDFNENALLPCYVLENSPEFIERCSLYFSINFSTKFAFPNTIKVFGSDYCIILLCQGNDLMRYLVAPSSIEVSFTPTKTSKGAPRLSRTMIGVSLKFRSSNTDITFSLPNVLAKIKLFQTSLCNRIINCNCSESICSNVRADYLLTRARFGSFKFTFKYNLDNPRILKGEFKMGKLIASFNKVQKALVSIIFFDGERNSSVNCSNSKNGVVACSCFKRSTSGYVIGNWQFFKTVWSTFSFAPNFAAYILNKLRWNPRAGANNGVNEVMKFAA